MKATSSKKTMYFTTYGGTTQPLFMLMHNLLHYEYSIVNSFHNLSA